MAAYESRILHALLDSYENSLLSRGENKIAIQITYPFTRKNVPEYFDESSLAYEEIHMRMKELERKKFVEILWKRGRKNHIIQSIRLSEAHVKEIYEYLNRTPKEHWENVNLRLLDEMKEIYQTPVVSAFLSYLSERIGSGKTVKEYIDLADTKRTKMIIKAIGSIETNQEECYIREFSIRCLSDTKQFQSILGVIGKIMNRFSDRFEKMDIRGILAEYSIYDTPNYVYVKGNGQLYLTEDRKSGIDLTLLKQGIGLSGEDLQSVKIVGQSDIRKIITIENLTTFFRWDEEDGMIIYLGGYHNSVRRRFLQMIYQAMPDREYLHFGDIDVGGFEIYEDLCCRAEIPFQPYNMGVTELQKYGQYTKPLTANDKKRLQAFIEKKKETACGYMDVLEYMMEHEVKLEQECVER